MNKNDMKIIYITRDIERALGIAPNDNYMIVSNKTLYTATTLDTAELLEQDRVRDYINENGSTVLVFKNTSRIEDICKKNSWNLLNPSSALAEKYENKITQVEWLGELAKYLPPYSISLAKNLKWFNQPIVVQWAHGHTGDGTILVNSEKELSAIQAKFPERLARTTTFINGPTFTVNVVVASNTILIGNISYQITGLAPFTDNPFSTVGNDWGEIVPALLNKSEIEYINQMAREIGEKMRADGWKGLFGIDVIRDDRRNQIFLIEINARQPASTTFESQLQELSRGNPPLKKGVLRCTSEWGIFEAHLLALQNKPVDRPLIQINDGAQIVQRITNKVQNIPDDTISALESAGYQVIPYSNTEMNSDLLRVQSMKGVIEKHEKLNARGKEIVEKIKK